MNRGGRGGGGFNRGRGRGGAGGGGNFSRSPVQGSKNPSTTPDSVPMDMVRPVLPPLYPEYIEGVCVDGMDRELNEDFVTDFVEFKECFKSNYSVEYVQRVSSGFEVDKFTDTYEDPFRVDPRLQHFIDKKYFPSELYVTRGKPVLKKKVKKEVDTKEILEKLTIKEEKFVGF